jgi:exonuclease III
MNLLTYKIATININGIHSTSRTKMLEDFLHINEIDVLRMQEVTITKVTMIRKYTTHVNIGIEGRGKAILYQVCYPFTDIEKLPTGRGISGMFNDMEILSVYGLSGSECKRKLEDFFDISVPQLLRHPRCKLIIAGDFNCVLQPTDTTGTFHTSGAFRHLVTGMDLHDSWDRGENTTVYTHYTHKGTARLDRS